jgi:hypothetical protein
LIQLLTVNSGREAKGREIAGGLRWRSGFERRLRGASEEEKGTLVRGVGELGLSYYRAEGGAEAA